MKMNPQAEKGWMDADRMTFVGLILAVLGLIVAIAGSASSCGGLGKLEGQLLPSKTYGMSPVRSSQHPQTW